VATSFEGRLAVVTGGGSGMGRELVVQLAAEGCHVATCDLNDEGLRITAERAAATGTGVRISTHRCDVADEAQVQRFRDEVLAEHQVPHVDLLFNNAGIGGGGSFVAGDRAAWERTFGVCWGGVYACCRVFLPLVLQAPEGWIVNTSSVNGFWASLGPGVPHTANSAAKFAVKGFSEALIEDLRVNAPHVHVSVVMPGHIGTDIVANSRRAHGGAEPEDMDEAALAEVRAEWARRGAPVDALTDDDVRKGVQAMAEGFRDRAPTTAAEAATIILDGVRAGEWRILVGDDAVQLDQAVRADPVGIYAAGNRDGINTLTI
jgi:NAD(P)-dependent dehydrogenase (short-subunit alcohol dehydrogenase family)